MSFERILFNLFRKPLLPEIGLLTLRAKQFDEKVKTYITEHPRASVVNIGAGLDTTFYRVDNGLIHWYDLDLPSVIDIRRQLLPEPDRVTYIARSLFDPSWCKDVEYTKEGVFMIAGGMLHYFEESQVKQFFSMLADNFHGGEIVLDILSRSDDGGGGLGDILSPEQRDLMRKALVDATKEWRKKAPQGQKEKLNDMIATLVPTTPKGKAWSEDAREITKWDGCITVIDQFSIFKNIPRDSLDADMRRFIDYNDEQRMSSIIHLRV